MKRRTRLADALFGEPHISKGERPTEASLEDLRSTVRVHRASQRYGSNFEGVFEFSAEIVDVNPPRVHVDEETAARLEAITGERQTVWTFYRGVYVVDMHNAPMDYELYLGDLVKPRVTMRSYDKGQKWAMDVHNVCLLKSSVHFTDLATFEHES